MEMHVGDKNKTPILPTSKTRGYEYVIPEQNTFNNGADSLMGKGGTMDNGEPVEMMLMNKSAVGSYNVEMGGGKTMSTLTNVVNTDAFAAENKSIGTQSKSSIALNELLDKKGKRGLPVSNVAYTDVWLWKCIPTKDDKRPKWLQMYDNGEVIYKYEHRNSLEYEEYFRVRALHKYLEVLCTDSRCPSLTIHPQRLTEMKKFSLDYLQKLTFLNL